MSLFLLFVFSLSFKELDALKKLLFSSAILGGMGFLYYKDRKNLFFEYIIPLTFGKEATVTYYEPIKISRYFIDMYWHIKYGFIVPDTDLQFDSSVTIPIKMVNNDNTIFDTPRVFYIKENPYISSIATKELLNKFCLRKRS